MSDDQLPRRKIEPPDDRADDVDYYLLVVDRYDEDDILIGTQYYSVIEGDNNEYIVSSVSDYRR